MHCFLADFPLNHSGKHSVEATRVSFVYSYYGPFLKINEAMMCWRQKASYNTINGARRLTAGKKHTLHHFINHNNYICLGEVLSTGQCVVNLLNLFVSLSEVL